MLTNLVVSVVVAVVTNTTTTDNAKGCPARPKPIDYGNGIICVPAIYHPWHEGCTEYVPATEKTEVTTVTRVTTFETLWNGKNVTLRDEETLSRKEQKYSLQSEWKAVSNNVDVYKYIQLSNVYNCVSNMFSIGVRTNSALILLQAHTNELLYALSVRTNAIKTVTITNHVVVTNQAKHKLW